MQDTTLSVTDGSAPAAAHCSPDEGGVFTAAGFLHAMTHRRSPVGSAALLTPSSQLAPVTLDEHPDPATAWVTGFYALTLRRRADAAGLHEHSRAIRNGAPPASVLDGILSSPEAVLAGANRPDLPEAYVTGAYLVGLGRVPDPQGLRQYVVALADGMDEQTLLDSLLASDEAASQLRFPPSPVERHDRLSQTVQTVALRVTPTDEHTAWARSALRAGVPPRQVVRSLARRVHGVSRAGISAAVTARLRAALALRAAENDVLHEELLRERAWQWRLHRSTWERLERLERLVDDRERPHGTGEGSALR